MSDAFVIVAIAFLAFAFVGFLGWFAYRGGYVAGYEDAIDTHNLAIRLRATERRPATRDGDTRYPYRGEVE
jgi:hypothetical protein